VAFEVGGEIRRVGPRKGFEYLRSDGGSEGRPIGRSRGLCRHANRTCAGSVTWYDHDGSTIKVSMQNQSVQGHALPATENVTVSMPKYNLDATAKYGDYSLGAAVPDSIFGGT
jgi:hypothetical protein